MRKRHCHRCNGAGERRRRREAGSLQLPAVSCAASPRGATAPPDSPNKRLRRAPEVIVGEGSGGR
eukprot:15479173-Alexandrium_andersonii.AAC.1